MIIPFGEYLPDLPAHENPGLIVAKNCLPHSASYKGLPAPVEYSTAISESCRGFFSAQDKDGNAYSYCGDVSDLYRLSDASWTGATRASGGDYQTALADRWEMVKWGERVIATNYTDAVQEITMGSSNFVPLAGTPPRARHAAVVKDFLVLGNCHSFSTSAKTTNRLHWCGINDVETWEPSAATQADYQDLQGNGGWIQRIIGGQYGTVFQERSIWRMTYIGSPLVFQFDEIEPGKGTGSPGSVVVRGSTIFYLGLDNFYRHDAGMSTPISNDRVYKTFLADYDPSYYYNVTASVDPVNPYIFWAYPGVGNTGGRANRVLVYNAEVNRWAIADLEIEAFGQMQAEGYTLEGLDAVSSSLDALPFSLDSRVWAGGALNLSAFNSDHRLVNFTGTAMDATFETGEKNLAKKGGRAYVRNSRPIVAGGTISVQIGKRDLLNQSASFGSAISVNSDGECPTDSEGRYHRFKVNTTGDFEHAQGLDVEAVSVGRY
jgi:hypothetical protein